LEIQKYGIMDMFAVLHNIQQIYKQFVRR